MPAVQVSSPCRLGPRDPRRTGLGRQPCHVLAMAVEGATLRTTDFVRVDIRVGRVVGVEDFPDARKPAFKLASTRPAIGIKKLSAQATKHYSKTDLLIASIVAVVNFPPKKKIVRTCPRSSRSACRTRRRCRAAHARAECRSAAGCFDDVTMVAVVSASARSCQRAHGKRGDVGVEPRQRLLRP